MARVHVDSWRQTYRGLVADAVPDDPGLLSSRERFWTGALTDERWSANRIAVAEVDDVVVGIAMSGPSDEDAQRLHLIHLDATHHGSGAGAALLDAVREAGERTVLRVSDPNPRAQAFHRRRGFVPTGSSEVVDGVRQVEWVRNPRPGSAEDQRTGHRGAGRVTRRWFRAVDDVRARGVLAGFDDSADLGGLPLPDGSTVLDRRVVRANTPPDLSPGDRTAAEGFGLTAVLDLRAQEEVDAVPHPLMGVAGYRWVPLIDQVAEAGEDVSRYRTGTVVALLLDLVGVAHDVIAADHVLGPGPTDPDARNIVTMLDHVRDVHGSSAGYLRSIGLDDEEVSALRRRVSP